MLPRPIYFYYSDPIDNLFVLPSYPSKINQNYTIFNYLVLFITSRSRQIRLAPDRQAGDFSPWAPPGSMRFYAHYTVCWRDTDTVKKFETLEGMDFIIQSSGDKLSNRLAHEANSILNFGVGMDFPSEKMII